MTGWEKFVRRLADSKYHVYVTGSNAKMLSREIATTLGGRFMMRVVYPYDFSEYLMALGIDGSPRKQLTMKGKAAISSAFDAYLENGAFPELIDVHSRRMYLNNIYQRIYPGISSPGMG